MKATAAEAEARTAKVAEWLVEGRSRADICQNAREKGWGISDSQVDRYIARARRAIREGHRKDWDMTLAMADARFESLYRMALDKGDLRLAASIVKEHAALMRPRPGDDLIYAHDADFMAFIYEYAELLKAVLPPDQLARVWQAAHRLDLVRESIEDACGGGDELMRVCVEDHRTLGRGRTREELVDAGLFDGLVLPGDSRSERPPALEPGAKAALPLPEAC